MGFNVPCGSNCILHLFLLFSLGVGDFFNSSTFPDNLYDSNEEFFLISSTANPEMPQFDPQNPKNVSVHLGATAFLHCKVTLVKDKTVSWLKMESPDPKLLTFGLHTYSKNSRYSINIEQSGDWKLRIENVEKDDGGDYKCQVSFYPKPVSISVHLFVIVPSVTIVDELGRRLSTDKYYNEGSTLELRCVVREYQPSFYSVQWRLKNITLNVDGGNRGGISVKTMGTKEKGQGLSVLYIAKAKENDSGLYECSVARGLASSSIAVHVIKGETQAAIHRTSNNGYKISSIDIIKHFLFVFFIFILRE